MIRRFTTSVFPVYKNKILLIKHKKLNLWLPPGGKLEIKDDGFYEIPFEGARRELFEETGLRGRFPIMKGEIDGTPLGFLGFEEHWISSNEYHMNFCFMCFVDTDEIISDGSYTDHRWCGVEEAKVLATTRNVIDLIDKISYLI